MQNIRLRPVSAAAFALPALLAVLIGLALLPGRTSAATATVTGGSLDWGVKDTFVAYITGGIAQGEIVLNGGAVANGDGTYRFSPASGTADSATGLIDATFGGGISFTGHNMGAGPLLELHITALRVDTSGGAAVLRADIASKSLSTAQLVSYPNVAFASLNFAGIVPQVGQGSLTFANVPVTLTEAGVEPFADFYPAGTALAPITFTINIEDATPGETVVPTETAAPTETAVPTETVPSGTTPTIVLSKTVFDPAGDTVTVTGTGFLPSLAIGARPPLAGQAAGVYVAFGAFADTWRPSEGAPSSARPSLREGGVLWAVPAESRPIVGEGSSVTLNPDGSFTAVLRVQEGFEGALADGNYGIYTYPGSGAVQPLFETFTPITFAQEPAPSETSTVTSTATTPATTAPATATATTAAPKPPSTGSGMGEETGSTSLLPAAAIAVLLVGTSFGLGAVALRRHGENR